MTLKKNKNEAFFCSKLNAVEPPNQPILWFIVSKSIQINDYQKFPNFVLNIVIFDLLEGKYSSNKKQMKIWNTKRKIKRKWLGNWQYSSFYLHVINHP